MSTGLFRKIIKIMISLGFNVGFIQSAILSFGSITGILSWILDSCSRNL